jgi:hypothetical protein
MMVEKILVNRLSASKALVHPVPEMNAGLA